jgi:hypothetical protein
VKQVVAVESGRVVGFECRLSHTHHTVHLLGFGGTGTRLLSGQLAPKPDSLHFNLPKKKKKELIIPPTSIGGVLAS